MEGSGFCFRMRVAVVVLAVVVGQLATADIQCSDVLSQIIPCEGFLLGTTAGPDGGCCAGVQALGNIAAASQSDKRAICACFKEAAKSFPINWSNAQQLPTLCNVSVDVPIDPNVDCNSI